MEIQYDKKNSTSRNNFNLLWIPFCRNPTERPVGQEGQERIRDPVKRYVWDRKKIESMGLCQTFTTTFDLFRKLLTFFNYRLLERMWTTGWTISKAESWVNQVCFQTSVKVQVFKEDHKIWNSLPFRSKGDILSILWPTQDIWTLNQDTCTAGIFMFFFIPYRLNNRAVA